jgi:thiamine biosynthesis protein ThiI
MAMAHLYMVHYGEIALKGRNRPDFENQLVRNIKQQHPGCTVRKRRGRLIVESEQPLDLSNVLGVAWWSEAVKVPSTLESIVEAALSYSQHDMAQAETFAVRVKRASKKLEHNSQELEGIIGGELDRQHAAHVDLAHPDYLLHVEITSDGAYLYTDKEHAWRGLPVGVSGKLMGLFSAGIDSAVASFLMAKRGADIELIHFHAFGRAAAAHDAKVGELAGRLSKFIPRLVLHYIPYHHFQIATAGLSAHQRQELIVFRRFMALTAEQLGAEQGVLGLYTGDNLGQVASQTLENLAAVDDAIRLPIYRPLIAYDKQEIIDLGIELGLDEAANLAYKDCCSIVARHPATRAKLNQIEAIESAVRIKALVESSLAERVTYVADRDGAWHEIAKAAA